MRKPFGFLSQAKFLILMFAVPAFANAANVTGEYRATWQASSAAESEISAEIAQLQGFEVLFVNGFLANATSALGGGATFDDQKAALDAYGIAYSQAEIIAAASVARNAEIVGDAIAASSKPLLLITYSKGSLDALEALRRRPELVAKVRGWWMLQSPLYGTPVADYAEEGRLPALVAGLLFDLIGGDSEAIGDMTVESRKKYMRAHAAFLADLGARVKILSFTTWKDDEFLSWDTDFRPIRDLMLLLDGVDNDGIVPARSMQFPGAEFVAVEGLDHLAAVQGSRRIEFDRPRFSRVILKMLGKRLLP